MTQDAVSLGLARRPEMEALDLAARSASLASQAANAQGGPQVALVGEVYAADDEFFPQKQNDWKVTLLASWSFFDGGASSARAREARAAAEEFLFRMEDMKRQIELEISVARLNCESSLQRISTGGRWSRARRRTTEWCCGATRHRWERISTCSMRALPSQCPEPTCGERL